MKTLDISVIVPLYHGTKYLPGILETVRQNAAFAGDALRVELVLVQDSPEEAEAIRGPFAESFPVRTVFNAENEGIQRSRINGLKAARGTYVLFLDQDDTLAERALLRLYQTAKGSAAAYSDWAIERLTHGKPVTGRRRCSLGKHPLALLLRDGNRMGPPCHCLLRRDCIPENWQRHLLTINGADDYLLWLCMLAEGREFAYCPETLYTHRFNAESCSTDELRLLQSEQEAFAVAAGLYAFTDAQKRRHAKHLAFRRELTALRQSGAPAGKRIRLYGKHPQELFRRIAAIIRRE